MSQKENKDPFIRLKYIAFCRNYMSPDAFGYQELVNYAKNFLCLTKNVLYYDPLWDLYTDEAVLIEFYSVRMHQDNEYRQEIEAEIKGKGNTEEDDVNWMLKRQVEEDKKRDDVIKKIKEEADFSYKNEDGVVNE